MTGLTLPLSGAFLRALGTLKPEPWTEILKLPPKGLRVNEPRAQESSREEMEQGGLVGLSALVETKQTNKP